MRIIVTGKDGQVATALREAAGGLGVSVVAIGRPHLDLEHPETVSAAIEKEEADVFVNAAAWTAVDQAETESKRAFRVNADGAAAVAAAAQKRGIPVIQISTDYVFDGRLDRAYREDDATGPTGAYGAGKLAGEVAVSHANPDHAIVWTAWVHAPMGKNFLRTMMRLAETKDEVGVVADQFGTPTYAPDIAEGIVKVAQNLLARPQDKVLRGVFHMAASGPAASWADFAESIFAELSARGLKAPKHRRMTTADYPTPALRPANSRLDCTRIASVHDVTLPDWRTGVAWGIARLVQPNSQS